MLLYGFGTKRDEALASQHSVMRQLSGILTSQHSEMPTNLDESSWADIRNSFLKLSYNDRQNVVAHCYNQIVYQLDSAVDDSSSIRTALPPSKAIDFVMQLSESAACVSLILDIAECVSNSIEFTLTSEVLRTQNLLLFLHFFFTVFLLDSYDLLDFLALFPFVPPSLVGAYY